ncbi:glycine oxidase ThiO [Marinicrinis sediminis]|uniref:glycine oxidase n=1 Tax=Marinicrinis sediminis TaxID=1652465 RepID=A0ABW5RCB0_9BACL
MVKQIVIVGGGIIGLSCAFELAMRGHAVTIVEQGECGGQASGAAAGMLTPYSENVEQADPFFLFSQESLRLYPEWIRQIGRFSQIDAQYRQSGSLNVVFHQADLLPMEKRLHWQRQYGLEAEIVEGERLRKLEPALSPSIQAAVHVPEEAHLYAPSYARALKDACEKAGVQICEHEQVTGWKQDARTLITRSDRNIPYEQLLICSGAWTGMFAEALSLELPVYPIRGQICAFPQREEAPVHHIVFSSQGYMVAKDNGSFVIGASEDVAGFCTDVTEQGIERLCRWSRKVFPHLNQLEPHFSWAGLRPATQDGFPLLGWADQEKGIAIAAGHYRNGILLSPVTAQSAADLLEGEANRGALYRQAFEPQRFTSSISSPAGFSSVY